MIGETEGNNHKYKNSDEDNKGFISKGFQKLEKDCVEIRKELIQKVSKKLKITA